MEMLFLDPPLWGWCDAPKGKIMDIANWPRFWEFLRDVCSGLFLVLETPAPPSPRLSPRGSASHPFLSGHP